MIVVKDATALSEDEKRIIEEARQQLQGLVDRKEKITAEDSYSFIEVINDVLGLVRKRLNLPPNAEVKSPEVENLFDLLHRHIDLPDEIDVGQFSKVTQEKFVQSALNELHHGTRKE